VFLLTMKRQKVFRIDCMQSTSKSMFCRTAAACSIIKFSLCMQKKGLTLISQIFLNYSFVSDVGKVEFMSSSIKYESY
jgi:hypothetical protein